jgi:hypothetical protein
MVFCPIYIDAKKQAYAYWTKTCHWHINIYFFSVLLGISQNNSAEWIVYILTNANISSTQDPHTHTHTHTHGERERERKRKRKRERENLKGG